ncbi:DUF3723 domain-containing protein [Aspergillus tanneri]|uniref:Uncharacterized protein n=1 Tax=Aspergillus tanneri TaxID=1220188 RepID=A0A5M9N1D1_9EURO|nr:uncharacterized protein ATNIH1004_000990 [Aspergillus tanneri]KAA8652086.1 hypothetical protein ATNIH1004_000990 [Aspergillus tanneri]
MPAMRRALFTEEEVRLATERRLKYLGTAKVSINQIEFDPPLPRDLDPKNLGRLREIFRKNRCRRLDVDNHVPAIVSCQDLAAALRKANVPQQLLLTNDPHQCPQLRFAAGQLRALHGRHRVQAGTEVLPPADRWWMVDLYLDDIGEELRTSLVEEYANQKKPTDGEIYRKIRQYEGEDNEAFRQRWFVRLSPSNQDRLDQLDNKRNRRLRRAFDRLLPITGLWAHGMRISMLHRLIATGCVEEILTYLDHIGDFWSSLVASDYCAMKKIDSDTVNALQLMAPGKSRTDAKKAGGLILGGQAFAEFSEEERRIIWNRMKTFNGLVPSLYTFFEDFKYLESCAHCVKRLFGASTESVWNTMSSMFIPSLDSEAEEIVIQVSESTFRHERATDAERLDKGYLQVWLYAMRHYPLMPPAPKNDDDLLAKPARARADERAIYEMAELARRLGFDSPEIKTLIDGSPDHQIARAALLQARKPNCFQYDAEQFDTLVSQIVDCFATAVPVQPEIVPDLLADSTVRPRARCGMPRMRTHKQDSPFLFLDLLHADDVGVADTITTLFVRRCVYFAFFGKPTRPGPSGGDHTGETPGDIPPWSPLFVGEDGPSADPGLTLQSALSRELPQQEQGQPEELRVRQDGERQILRSRQAPRGQAGRGVLQRQRMRKVQTRRRLLHSTGKGDQEPMQIEWLNTERSDQDMSDQSHSSPALPDVGLAIIPHAGLLERNTPNPASEQEVHATLQPERQASSMLRHYGPLDPEEGDTNSHCTRISLEAAPLEQNLDDRPTIEGPHRDGGPQDQARIDYPSQPQSADPEGISSGIPSVISPGRQQQGLDAYIDHLMRAQEEQEKLEEELEHERLEEELGLFNQEQPVLELPPRPHEGENSPPRSPNNHLVEAMHSSDPNLIQVVNPEPTQDPSPVSHGGQPVSQSHVENPELIASTTRDDANNLRSHSPPKEDAVPKHTVGTLLSPGIVEISFWAFQQEQWVQTDRLQVDPLDPSLVERVARKYTWKKYSLYDKNLQSLSPAQCYRAATVDGNNAVFLISEQEEQRLAAEGRLTKDKQLLSLVSRVLDSAGSEPSSLTKRHRVRSETSEEI